jgi:hypothetical protein
MAEPPKVHEAIGVDANSEATQTTTILSGWAVPIDTFEYVATLAEALTPAGLAVWVIETAMLDLSRSYSSRKSGDVFGG